MEALPYQITGGRWHVTGPLPNDCQLIETDQGQIFTDAVGTPQPDCFGVYWEAVGPDTDTQNCRDCDLEPLCRTATVHFHIPKVLAAAGGQVTDRTVEAIAPELELNHEAVAVLLKEFQRTTAPQQGVQPKRPKRRPPGSAERHVPPPGGTEGGPPENPMLAPSAQIVTDGATQTAIKALYAQLARVWDSRRMIWIRPWEARIAWKRERQQNRWIDQLLPGMILRRSYAGKWWTVKVRWQAYQFQGRLYPTLGAVTQAIFSQVPLRHRMRRKEMEAPSLVVRFWCLEKLLTVSADRKKVPEAAERQVRWLLHRFSQECEQPAD